jgi:hypothetical protein
MTCKKSADDIAQNRWHCQRITKVISVPLMLFPILEAFLRDFPLRKRVEKTAFLLISHLMKKDGDDILNDLLIRNVDDYVLMRLTEMAKSKGISRSAYVRDQLTLLSEYPDLMEKDEAYKRMFDRVIPILEKTLEMLAANSTQMGETRQILYEVRALLKERMM